MKRRGSAAASLIAAIGICFGLAATEAGAGQRIVNGLKSQAFPTTGALLYSTGGNITTANATTSCSGTLIGCSTFLTAAHCVIDDAVASHYWVYLQHGGIAHVSSVTYNPSYDPNGGGRDVAIVKLSSPVTGIKPMKFNSTHNLQAIGVGLVGTIAGFGQTSGSGNDYGIKRYGLVSTAHCDTGVTGGEGDDVLVCWNYQSPVGSPGTDSNTCNGDSGGPLFADFSGVTEVVGVTSYGTSNNCLPTDNSVDASVFHNASWITTRLGADSTSTCGGIPAVGDAGVTQTSNSGSLGSGNLDDAFEVTLTGTPSLVRFTLNGTDNGSFNPDLFVKQGTGASASNYDCKSDGTTMYGACELASPAAGTWSVFVKRTAGSGEYQVTTTVFGGSAPVCGNDVVESGEECDGTADAACPGQCEVGCTCPAPVCGNNVVESGEECDGTADAACPGQCNGSCNCAASGCSSGDLYGLLLATGSTRFTYKAELGDPVGDYAALDPRNGFGLSVVDGAASVHVEIPTGDPGWAKSKPLGHRFSWKGDGTLDGLRQVKLQYKSTSRGDFWVVNVKGKGVPGASSLNLGHVLDFELTVDGTCHDEAW